MPRPRVSKTRSRRVLTLNLRKLKKELKNILIDVHRQVRFLDLLFNERDTVRTRVERDVIKDLIDSAKSMIEFHQNRLERYRECYRQIKEKKSFDRELLKPDELQSLLKWPATPPPAALPEPIQHQRRTGTDG